MPVLHDYIINYIVALIRCNKTKYLIYFVLNLTISIPVIANTAAINNACQTKMYENSEIGINVNASRDIGPVTRMDGSGLIISVDIFTLAREQLPETLELAAATAVLNQAHWDMNNSNDISISRYFDGTGFSFIFREGPLWPVDSSININLTLKIKELTCEFSQLAVRIEKNT